MDEHDQDWKLCEDEIPLKKKKRDRREVCLIHKDVVASTEKLSNFTELSWNVSHINLF